jgi:hypothetical protein
MDLHVVNRKNKNTTITIYNLKIANFVDIMSKVFNIVAVSNETHVQPTIERVKIALPRKNKKHAFHKFYLN